ncbi:MAG: BamA/TamA family outer membrane protein [Candidatus Syntrophosphaera sp.]
MKFLPGLLAALLFAAGCGAVMIEKVSFEADFPIDAAELKEAANLQSGLEYDPATVNAALGALQSRLGELGHPFVEIPFPEIIPLSASGIELRFRLREVLAADRTNLSFSGLRYFTPAKLREILLLAEDEEVPISRLPALMERILGEYNRRGYLFARVKLDSLALGEGLTAHIGIDEGRPLQLENFYFEGNKYTRDRTLVKLSGLERGKAITPEVLNAARENILAKSYINSCLIEPVDPSSVLIRIGEGKMTYVEGVLGLSRDDGEVELTGLLNLRFLNLWGSDRSIGLNWRKTPFSDLLSFAYHESGPHTFPLAGDLLLSREARDSTWIKSSASADIFSYSRSQNYGTQLSGESITLYSWDETDSLSSRKAENIAAWSAGAFWRLDSRDARFNPNRGMQTGITYRIRHSDTGRRWSNALEADHTQYFGLSPRWTVALGMHLRSLAVRDSTDYLQYRLGGFNSLRGYREDEFSSWRLGWANLELRHRIGPQARIYLFYDHGLLARPGEGYRADLFAPGLGIRVRTRLGILSIEYGLGYRENGFPDPGSGMIHAGLDASF